MIITAVDVQERYREQIRSCGVIIVLSPLMNGISPDMKGDDELSLCMNEISL
jgi:hypothetical protein